MHNYIYGIDFGTTNSAIAILNVQTNEVVKIITIPSLLYFPKNKFITGEIKYFVGSEAINEYISSKMNGRFMKSIKKVLPNKSFINTQIGSKSFKAEDLASLIIKHLKSLADKFLGEDIKTAVFGRPVYFDENKLKDELAQKRLYNAAVLSGFENITFQYEPIGAAYAYERSLSKDEIVLVGDFGGGTSDFTLMKLSPNSINKKNRTSDMLSQGGIYIGGDNFDSDIMWYKGTPHFGRGLKENTGDGKLLDLPLSYFHYICSWEKMNFLNTTGWISAIKRSYSATGKNSKIKNLLTLIEKNLGYSVFQSIERAKMELSTQNNSKFFYDNEGILIDEEIEIEELKSLIINKNLQKIKDYLDLYIIQSNQNIEQIDSIFLTGGTSMVRPLRDIFISKFGYSKLKSGDNLNSVAMGLAYSFESLTEY